MPLEAGADQKLDGPAASSAIVVFVVVVALGTPKSFGWGAPLDAGRTRLADQWSLDWLARTAAISIETAKNDHCGIPAALSVSHRSVSTAQHRHRSW
jgi:hypothetical protein